MAKSDQSREDLGPPGRIDWQEPGNLRERVCPEALAKQTYTPPTTFGGGFVQLLMSEMHAGNFPLTLPGPLLGHSCLICRLSLSLFAQGQTLFERKLKIPRGISRRGFFFF